MGEMGERGERQGEIGQRARDMGRASRFGHAAGAYIAYAVTCQQNAPARVSRQAHLRERSMRLHPHKPAAAGGRQA